jgi:hypothetical protein
MNELSTVKNTNARSGKKQTTSPLSLVAEMLVLLAAAVPPSIFDATRTGNKSDDFSSRRSSSSFVLRLFKKAHCFVETLLLVTMTAAKLITTATRAVLPGSIVFYHQRSTSRISKRQ